MCIQKKRESSAMPSRKSVKSFGILTLLIVKFMKKNHKYEAWHYHALKKTFLVMRIVIVISLVCIMQSFAFESYTQNSKISLSVKEMKLEDIMMRIEDQTKYRFAYNRSEINVDKSYSVDISNAEIKELLDKLFLKGDVNYTIIDRQIVLSSSKESSITQQQKSISGKVTDSFGSPLPGVTVVVKGTTQGTISSSNGEYSLPNVSSGATLVFSFVGLKTKEIIVTNKDVIDVILNDETIGMDEVVVIGYGSQSIRNVTGSISKIDMKENKNLSNTNIMQSLRGNVAGVQFTDNGRPGQGGSILIRGQRSLSGSNAPLIILDGSQYNGSINDLNPNDISSMEILKDASAAAIYGSRAANGVILISLKEGATEKPTIKFNAFYGLSDWSHKIKLLSPERYLEKTLEIRRILGLEHDPSKIRNYLAPSEVVNYDAGKTTDPWDAISQQGRISTFDLSISGKTDRTKYYLSGSTSNEQGLIFNDSSNRLSFHSNIENKINNWLTVGLNASFTRRNMSGIEASISNAYFASPYGTYYYDDGTPTQTVVEGENNSANPLRSSLLTDNEEIYTNLLSTFYTEVDIPFIKGLQYKLNYSPNYRYGHNYNFIKPDKHISSSTTSASKYLNNNFDWVFENILKYNKVINKNNAFDLTLLYGRNHLGVEETTANATQLSVDALGWNNLSLGNILTNTSYASEEDGVSSMFRLNYRYMNKYLFTFTARRDGSSVFASNHKYATFPSASLAWVTSEEPFIKKVKFIDLLKLRLSYGSVGNQAISRYGSLSLASSTKYVYGDGGATSVGIYSTSMANSDLKWETTISTNGGLDFEILSGRVGGTLEFYNMKTTDLLVKRSLPAMTGFSSIWTNLGEINNKGIEFSLNTVNFKTKQFEWNSNLVFSKNINKIVHLYNSDTNNDGKEDNDLGNYWFIGQPISVFYDYMSDGIYQEGDVIPSGYKAGDIRFKDLNNDGKFTVDDKKIIGQAQPKYRWGLGNNFRYKNISLYIFINSMQGWIGSFKQADPNGNFGGNAPDRQLNQFDNGWWTPSNKSNTSPSLGYTNPLKANYYFSRDFLRIQDIKLAYEFPEIIIKRLKLTNLSVSISGKNLYTFTNWVGSDPEVGGTLDFPLPRTVSIGISTGF